MNEVEEKDIRQFLVAGSIVMAEVEGENEKVFYVNEPLILMLKPEGPAFMTMFQQPIKRGKLYKHAVEMEVEADDRAKNAYNSALSLISAKRAGIAIPKPGSKTQLELMGKDVKPH